MCMHDNKSDFNLKKQHRNTTTKAEDHQRHKASPMPVPPHLLQLNSFNILRDVK